MGDVDVELPRGLALGFRGVYGRCNPCNRRDVGLEDIREGIARVHAMYSRPNFAVGGTLLFARGADLESSAFSAKPGFGSQLRLGRVEGLRMDTGVGVLVDRQLALAFHWAMYVPVFAWRFDRTVLRVLLESRVEILIPHPTLLLVTAGMRVRVGPVLVGLRGAVFEEDLSLMLVVGVVVGREG